MRVVFLALAVALSLMWLGGCEGSSAPGAKSGASIPQSSPPPPSAPTGARPGSEPSAAPGAAAPSAAASPVSVRLSTGVGLPQPGPDGTLMSFSVDYQFVQGEPGSSEYTWVIDRSSGPPAREPVRLERQGTLSLLIPGWQPEEGPFRSHLEDQQSNRISASVEMR